MEDTYQGQPEIKVKILLKGKCISYQQEAKSHQNTRAVLTKSSFKRSHVKRKV